MTGFGNATCYKDGIHYDVELRSLNNRFFKPNIRLPEELTSLEVELETILRKNITRGTVVLSVSLKNTSESAAYELNQAALRKYITGLTEVCRSDDSTSEQVVLNIDPGSLLALPGVLQPPSNTEFVDQCRPVLKELVIQACEKMTNMREHEGHGLCTDLRSHLEYIIQRIDHIAIRAPQVIKEYHERLEARIKELMAKAELKVDEIDLIREIAVFAERSDISEENQRLRAHLNQFEDILGNNRAEPIGRTLDFLSQELLREANTIASKSNDAEVSRKIVEIKGAIDRIKEQVQNIE